jgi:hypothetical protein
VVDRVFQRIKLQIRTQFRIPKGDLRVWLVPKKGALQRTLAKFLSLIQNQNAENQRQINNDFKQNHMVDFNFFKLIRINAVFSLNL